MAIYSENLALIARLNAESEQRGTSSYGIHIYADRTGEERKARQYLTHCPDSRYERYGDLLADRDSQGTGNGNMGFIKIRHVSTSTLR